MSLKPYLQLVRAPAAFSAISNVAAAQLVARQGNVVWAELAVLCLASVCLLAAGMALNDCFDLAVDRQERPSRPLPSGQVPIRAGWTLGFVLLGAGIALAGLIGPVSLGIAAALAVAILLYDALLKSGPLGPFAMGLCRYLNWMLGLSVVTLTAGHFALPLPLFLYVTAVTWLSRTEAGPENLRMIVAAKAFLALAGASFVGLTLAGVYTEILVLLPASLLAAVAWRRLEACRRDFSAGKVQATVGLLLLGIIPLDVLIAFANGTWWAAPLLLLMLPGRWLGRRLYVT